MTDQLSTLIEKLAGRAKLKAGEMLEAGRRVGTAESREDQQVSAGQDHDPRTSDADRGPQSTDRRSPSRGGQPGRFP